MKAKLTKKKFDCIKMKWEIQEKIAERMKDMTPAERVSYLKSRVESGPFSDLLGRMIQH